MKNYIISGGKVLEESVDYTKEKETKQKQALSYIERQPETEVEKKIIEVLNQYIRPAVEGDGGNVLFHSFSSGKVSVVLQGACSGCPSSTITLKAGIETLLKKMIPEVEEVVALEE